MENIFSVQLKLLRQKQRLSQAELAQKLHISRQAISKWEKGEAEPDISRLIALSGIFSVPLDYLLSGKQSADEIILELKNVSKSFTQPVLKNVDFSIYSYDRVALLGGNGSGKSTIIKIIAGLLNNDQGEVLRYFNPTEDLSVMSQENILIESLKVREQVLLAARMRKIKNDNYINELLKEFNLDTQENKLILNLSGGQRRRLSLLISLLKSTKLLILDEPTVGMDLETIDFFWEYLSKVGGSVLTVTHDFNQIDKYFTKIVLLKDGVIAAEASVSEIHSNNQTIEQWYRLNNTVEN